MPRRTNVEPETPCGIRTSHVLEYSPFLPVGWGASVPLPSSCSDSPVDGPPDPRPADPQSAVVLTGNPIQCRPGVGAVGPTKPRSSLGEVPSGRHRRGPSRRKHHPGPRSGGAQLPLPISPRRAIREARIRRARSQPPGARCRVGRAGPAPRARQPRQVARDTAPTGARYMDGQAARAGTRAEPAAAADGWRGSTCKATRAGEWGGMCRPALGVPVTDRVQDRRHSRAPQPPQSPKPGTGTAGGGARYV